MSTPVQETISPTGTNKKKKRPFFYSRKAGRDKCRHASARSTLCSLITGQPIHFIVAALRLDIGSIIRFTGKDAWEWKHQPTFTLHPRLTRQKVTPQRAKVKEKEPVLLSAISTTLASTSASNCEAEHTAVTLQERNTFFNLPLLYQIVMQSPSSYQGSSQRNRKWNQCCVSVLCVTSLAWPLQM